MKSVCFDKIHFPPSTKTFFLECRSYGKYPLKRGTSVFRLGSYSLIFTCTHLKYIGYGSLGC